jgi:hypothetical protein
MLLIKNLPAYWRYLDYILRHFYSQRILSTLSLQYLLSNELAIYCTKEGFFWSDKLLQTRRHKGLAAWTITRKESRMLCLFAVVWFGNTPNKRTAKKWSLAMLALAVRHFSHSARSHPHRLDLIHDIGKPFHSLFVSTYRQKNSK